MPFPESYIDVQAITAWGDGSVHYVSSPMSVGQIEKAGGSGDTALEGIDSGSLQVDLDAQQAAPITLTVDFKSNGMLWINIVGWITLQKFTLSLKLTLDKATVTNKFNVSHTVVDVMSWVTEITDLQKNAVLVDPRINAYRYTGTFLHQPVDLISSESVNDLFVEQVIKVSLQTSHHRDPQKMIRQAIRDQIYSTLLKPNVYTGITSRDSINSMVTSWLLGGIADDIANTDDNNVVIQDIRIPEDTPDTLAIEYMGPRNVFVPKRPADWPTGYDFSPGSLANIQHIVVLTKENRSFDHILGYLSLPIEQGGMGRHEVDGLTGKESNSYNGNNFPVFPLNATLFSPSPPNGYESVHHAINGGRMDGFVSSYAEANSDRDEVVRQIMGYHTGATVPAFDALARDFAIGHRWFASHPGPTLPNRFCELTGRPNLDTRGFWEFENSSPIRPVFTPTIFDYLTGATDPISGTPITWRYFEHGYCSLRFFERYTFDHEHLVEFDDPENGFLACAQTGQLPSVSFIDPHFVDFPPGSNCDEPPSDIAAGQAFVQTVVEAVIASPAWNNTLLLIVYDEHGGFYDHVPPPVAVPVSDEFPITTYGVRIPAFVISPWVGAGTVFGHGGISAGGGGTSAEARGSAILKEVHFDHTSILKTIARRFLGRNPPYMGARYAAANDLSMVIGTHLRRPQFLPFIRYRLQHANSHMMLDVKLADRSPGAVLYQFPANGTVAQDFSFEDAGNDYVYIRSHVSHLYVTARDDALGHRRRQALGLIQDVKYPPTTSSSAARPELQKWKLSATGRSSTDSNLFAISNEAYPKMVLQPSNPHEPESPVVLRSPAADAGLYSWKVEHALSGTPTQ